MMLTSEIGERGKNVVISAHLYALSRFVALKKINSSACGDFVQFDDPITATYVH